MKEHEPLTIHINNNTLELIKADITDIKVDAFVYYAREDLEPGSGFGTAIKIRGGIEVKRDLKNLGPVNVTDAVMTTAGGLKASHIIHAVGPKFHEENSEEKLKRTIVNALKKADERGIQSMAFPLMGAGFYGVPLEQSLGVTIKTVAEYLVHVSGRRIIVCANDSREFEPARKKFTGIISRRAKEQP